MGKILAIIGGILRDNCLQLDMLVVRMDTLTVNRSATTLLLWSDACSAPSRGVRKFGAQRCQLLCPGSLGIA